MGFGADPEEKMRRPQVLSQRVGKGSLPFRL